MVFLNYRRLALIWQFPAEPEQYYFHPDHLGSCNYITNIDGTVSQHTEYFAFGETFVEEHKNSHNSPYKYNSKELDEETGWYYYGARYYDPKVSLWLSVDPLEEKYPYISPYAYAFNNPVKFIDPTGMEGDEPVISNADPGKSYGIMLVFPKNLTDKNDPNGALRQDFSAAEKQGLPIMQVENIKEFAQGLDKLAKDKINVSAFIIENHGGPTYTGIGNQKFYGTKPDFSSLKKGLSGKNVFFSSCNFTEDWEKHGSSTGMLMKFANQTNSAYVFSSDHGLLSGYKYDGGYGLNADADGHWGISKSFPFIRREGVHGKKANDFIMAQPGNRFLQVYNLRILPNGRMVWDTKDNITTGKKSIDLK